MNPAYSIRKATQGDVVFLADAIIGAEMSGTEMPPLATVFDLSTEGAKELVVAMLNEEIDGCEFSVSSFLLARTAERAVAAVGGWVEGQVDDMPSSILKSNLIGFTFPPKSVQLLRTRKDVIAGIQIERERGSLQIEYVYVDPSHRGRDLAFALIQEHLTRCRAHTPEVRKAQVQVFSNNTPAINLYERLSFATVRAFRSASPDALQYLPWNEKLLMERTLN